MNGLSKKEVELISSLEFDEKYFFTSADVDRFARDKTHRYNIIKHLLRKERIVKLNRTKYYLIPIKAKTGKWAELGFIVADEVMNGTDYFIGGWAAAHYWQLTEQVPMKIEVYSTKRQGKKKFLTTSLIFRRTTQNRLKYAVTKKIQGHRCKILNKTETMKWLSKRH